MVAINVSSLCFAEDGEERDLERARENQSEPETETQIARATH
jgi:hypothetical protein